MITHVAILDADGEIWALPKPNRHGHVIHAVHAKMGKPEALRRLANHIQGFTDQDGNFLNRRDAWVVAAQANQILPPYNPVDPSQRRWDAEPVPGPGELFSEDLW